MATSKNKKKAPSRRRNYEPVVVETGIQKFTPTGWANWLGFILFGGLAIVTGVETILALGRSGHTDWIVALVLTGLFGWMAVLFAITHWKDYI